MHVGLKRYKVIETIAREEELGEDALSLEEDNQINDEHDLSRHFPAPSEQMVALSNLVSLDLVTASHSTRCREPHLT